MKPMSRRSFLASSAASALAMNPTFSEAQSSITGKLLLVGTQTSGASKGIYAYNFDPASGEIRKLGIAATAVNPTFLCMTPDRKTAVVANEVEDFGGQKSGAVSTFSLDPNTGGMTQLSQLASKGGSPCHVTTDQSGHSVFAANYGGGSVVTFALNGGKLSGPVSFEQFTGHGADAARQEAPHAHRVTVTPDNKYLLVNDLGLDEIHVYSLDAATGRITPAETPAWKSPAGVGPRTLHFHPNGKFVYCVCELSCQVIVLTWDAQTATLTTGQVLQVPTEQKAGEVTGCDLVLDKQARFAYYINRGDDFVATLAISADGSRLTFQRRSPCGGTIPRHLTLDPSEHFLLIANQTSDTIAVYPRDPSSGHVSETGKTYPLSRPQCLVFPLG